MKPLAFVHHPARNQPLGLILVLGMLLLVEWAAYASTASVGLSFMLSLLFVAYMASFLYPSRYHADDDGITLYRLGLAHRFPWARFRRFSVQPGGLFLGTLARPGRIDSVRGVFLVMHPSQQAALQPFLDAYVRSTVGAVDSVSAINTQ